VAARLYQDNQRRLEEILRLEKMLLDELERNGFISLPQRAAFVPVEELLGDMRSKKLERVLNAKNLSR